MTSTSAWTNQELDSIERAAGGVAKDVTSPEADSTTMRLEPR